MQTSELNLLFLLVYLSRYSILAILAVKFHLTFFLNFQFSAKYSTFNTLSIFIIAILILSIKFYASSRAGGDGGYRGGDGWMASLTQWT